MSIIVFLIRAILHLCVFFGIWLLIQPLIENAIRRKGNEIDYRIRKRLLRIGTTLNKQKRKIGFYKHIDDLLFLANPKYESGISFLRFMVTSTVIFLSVFMVLILTINEMPNKVIFDNPFIRGAEFTKSEDVSVWYIPIVVAIISSLVPYLRLRYVYARKNIQASYDLLEVVKIFTKFTHLSIDAALDRTSKLLSEKNVLKVPLKYLADVYANYGSEAELDQELKRFQKAIGTSFAITFISNLKYAEREGGASLQDSSLFLTKAMEDQRKSIIDVKSDARDAIVIGSYGNLISLIVGITMLMVLLKPSVYLRLQFQTEVGIWFLTIIIVLMFISFVISSILSRPRLDY